MQGQLYQCRHARAGGHPEPPAPAEQIALDPRLRGDDGSGVVMIALRLEQSTVDAFKAGGRGYQTRMAKVLEGFVE